MENLNDDFVPFAIVKQVRSEWKVAVWNLKNRETKSEVAASILHTANKTYCVTLREALSFSISKSENYFTTCLPHSFVTWQSRWSMWTV